jgi:hypothetical protein
MSLGVLSMSNHTPMKISWSRIVDFGWILLPVIVLYYLNPILGICAALLMAWLTADSIKDARQFAKQLDKLATRPCLRCSHPIGINAIDLGRRQYEAEMKKLFERKWTVRRRLAPPEWLILCENCGFEMAYMPRNDTLIDFRDSPSQNSGIIRPYLIKLSQVNKRALGRSRVSSKVASFLKIWNPNEHDFVFVFDSQ